MTFVTDFQLSNINMVIWRYEADGVDEDEADYDDDDNLTTDAFE